LKRFEPPAPRVDVFNTLCALGGEGTLGDLAAVTGLSRREIEGQLDGLMSVERAHVRVSELGDVVYHLGSDRSPLTPGRLPASRATWAGFERKTLQLIRAREGVISLAELVEHTGLPVVEAEREMRRLVEWYGGVPQLSLDRHVVYAFPELMTTAHGRFPDREPRPAWLRARDPIRASRGRGRCETFQLALSLGGLGAAIAVSWLALGPSGSTVVFAAAAAATGLVLVGPRVRRALEDLPLLRFSTRANLRRYLLGHVVESALAGTGIVSATRAAEYLRARAGGRRVRRAAVEAALRELAAEFDATVSETNGERFFRFRNVKRQFLASHMVRKRMRLARTASGPTVFDTADSPEVATARELREFDRALSEGRPRRGEKKP